MSVRRDGTRSDGQVSRRGWRPVVAGTAAVLVLLAWVSVAGDPGSASAAPPAGGGSGGPGVAAANGARFRPDEVIVGFKADVSPAEQDAALRATSARRTRHLTAGVELAQVAPGRVLSTIGALKADPRVRYAEPNWESESAGTTPNDPSFPLQWADNNTGQTVNGTAGTAGADERSTAAWSVTTGSRSVVIVDIDTGVDYNHPDLAANVWTNPGAIGGCAAGTHGYNAITKGCDPMDDDTQYGGHGTHVAGILGAVGNNARGVTGVNWATTILPVKWVDSSGTGTTSNLVAGLDWVVKAKQAGINIRIVNDSDVFFGTAYSQALSDEIDVLGQNNILFVTSAGNSSDNNDNPGVRRYPCGYARSNELCVAASDQRDTRPSWSNYGVTSVDLAAPGNNIYSTLRNGNYGYINGTSMATPQVAGAAALILSHQDMTPVQLKARLLENVDALGAFSGVVRSGGRLNICRAMPGCASTSTAPATFGLTAVGANRDTFLANRKRVNRYPLNVAGSVSKLTMYLEPGSSSGSQVLEGIVYADSNGVPGARLAVSKPLTYSSTSAKGWYDLSLPAPLSLQPGTYWIGVITGASNNVMAFRWNSVSGSRYYNANDYTAGPTNPFGAGTSDSEQMSLYATFVPSTSTSTSPRPFNITTPAVSTPTGPAGGVPPQTGARLTATNGDWDFSPTGFAYQWLRCSSTGVSCTAISGATANTYVPGSADVGSTLQVRVTGSNASGSTAGTSLPTLAVQSAPAPGTATFGKTTIGASSDLSTANWERVDVFSLAQAGSITKLTIYLARAASGSQTIRGVLYADAAGTPGQLLASATPITFGTTAASGWYDLTFSSPVAVTAGKYWIGLQAGDTTNVTALRYDNAAANSGAVAPATYANGPLNPFGSASLQTEQISIYATYTPA